MMVIIAALLFACDTNDESYYLYDVNEDGSITVMGVSETYSKELSVPAQIDGKTVTAIGDYAFYRNTDIRKITLPDSVVTIGECAFADSDNLTSINIGKNCKSIGLQAFEGCISLEKIKLSGQLLTIEDLAFNGCIRLESFSPPASLNEIGVDVFNDCEQLIINPKNCPVIEAYANTHGIPTGFTESDDYQILKIAILTALALAIILAVHLIIKKIRKKTD